MKINFNEFLFMGVFLIGLAFYFFSSILFTPKEALIEKNGEIDKVKLDYNWVESTRGGQSIKCELTILLKKDKSKYSIFENIGQNMFHPKFEQIKNKLGTNQSTKIWIRKTDESSKEPYVFQIADQGNEILYNIKDAKSLSKFGFIGAFSIGLVFIIFSFKKKHENKI